MRKDVHSTKRGVYDTRWNISVLDSRVSILWWRTRGVDVNTRLSSLGGCTTGVSDGWHFYSGMSVNAGHIREERTSSWMVLTFVFFVQRWSAARKGRILIFFIWSHLMIKQLRQMIKFTPSTTVAWIVSIVVEQLCGKEKNLWYCSCAGLGLVVRLRFQTAPIFLSIT